MKYIYKDELIKTLQKSPVWTGLDAIARINAMDTIDIVRCKECRFWAGNLTDDESLDKIIDCRWRDNEVSKADDYCSYGERKGDE